MITPSPLEYPEKEKAPASTEASSELNGTPAEYTMPRNEQTEKRDTNSPFYNALNTAVVPFNELNSQGIPKRLPIMGDWFMEGDYGIIFAQRGVGKTWFSMGMASALNRKGTFGPWPVHDTPGVLYVDGEMPAESIHQRMEGMGADEYLLSLNHEVLHHKSDKMLNLAEPQTQKTLTQICLDRGIKVLFLDNLSSLVMGVAEDKADEWEKILQWFLILRKQGIAVVLVLHAGRSNQNPRGTSRREDATSWVIKLDRITDDAGEVVSGARFVSQFEKNRHAQTDPPDIQWHFQTDESGKVNISHKICDPYEALIAWVKNGLTTPTDIAREMGVAVGTISKLATKAIAEGRLKKNGREYELP
jgi:putative DNA primase/helicase